MQEKPYLFIFKLMHLLIYTDDKVPAFFQCMLSLEDAPEALHGTLVYTLWEFHFSQQKHLNN